MNNACNYFVTHVTGMSLPSIGLLDSVSSCRLTSMREINSPRRSTSYKTCNG